VHDAIRVVWNFSALALLGGSVQEKVTGASIVSTLVVSASRLVSSAEESSDE
jgi:hypothetical protein